jgi:hypothetical protein
MPRAEELSALVEATPAEEVDVLEAAAQELRELRDRLTDADDIAAWTPAADDGFTAACAKLGQVRGRHYLDWWPQLDAWRRKESDAADEASLAVLGTSLSLWPEAASRARNPSRAYNTSSASVGCPSALALACRSR